MWFLSPSPRASADYKYPKVFFQTLYIFHIHTPNTHKISHYHNIPITAVFWEGFQSQQHLLLLIFYSPWKGSSLTGNVLSKNVFKILFLWIWSHNIILFLPIKPSVLADKLATLHFIILLIVLKPSLLSKRFFFNYCFFQFSPAFLPWRLVKHLYLLAKIQVGEAGPWT